MQITEFQHTKRFILIHYSSLNLRRSVQVSPWGVGGAAGWQEPVGITLLAVVFIFLWFLFYRKWVGRGRRPSCLLGRFCRRHP